MVNCSLKLRIDTKNCIKCTHNLIFSCSAVCWNLNLDFPFQGGFFPHFQHQQPGQRQWSLYPEGSQHCTGSERAPKAALCPCRTCKVSTISPDSRLKRNLPNLPPQSSMCQPTLVLVGMENTETCPGATETNCQFDFPAASVALQLSSFPFPHKVYRVEEPVKQLV